MSEAQARTLQSQLAKAVKEGGTHVIPVEPHAETTDTLIKLLASLVNDDRPVLFVIDSRETRQKVLDAIQDTGANPELVKLVISTESVSGIHFDVGGVRKRPDAVIWDSQHPLSYELTNRFGHIAARVGSISTGVSLAILTARESQDSVPDDMENQVTVPEVPAEEQQAV